jgi:hypothetical protein
MNMPPHRRRRIAGLGDVVGDEIGVRAQEVLVQGGQEFLA